MSKIDRITISFILKDGEYKSTKRIANKLKDYIGTKTLMYLEMMVEEEILEKRVVYLKTVTRYEYRLKV